MSNTDITSTPSSVSTSESTTVFRMVTGPQLLLSELLECIICLQPCVSPIYECEDNGHLTCGICHDQLLQKNKVKCAICQNGLRFSAASERQSRHYNLRTTCLNDDHGCKAVVSASNLKEHLMECEYREIKCWCHNDTFRSVTPTSECDKPIPIDEYPKHLIKNTLKEFQDRIILLTNNVYNLKMLVRHILDPNDSTSKSFWAGVVLFYPRLIEFDNKHFVMHARINKNTFYWWVLILGGQEDADKYAYHTSLLLADHKGHENIDDAPSKFAVLPYHKYQKFDDSCGKYASAPGTRIATYHSVKSNDCKENLKFSFKVGLQISKA